MNYLSKVLPTRIAFATTLGALLAAFSMHTSQAAWTGSAGNNLYLDTGNWAGGTIDGVFDSIAANTVLTLGDADETYAIPTGWDFSYSQNSRLQIIQPAGSAATWALSNGIQVDIAGTNSNEVYLGAPSRGFILDLGGTTQTIEINEGLRTASIGIDTLRIYGDVQNGSLLKTGGGTLRFYGPSSFSGDLTIEGGTVTTSSNGLNGALTNVSTVRVLGTDSKDYGRMVLNADSGTDQINDSAVISLNGGVFGLQATTGASTETTGTLSLQGARSVVGVISNTGTTSLTFNSIDRNSYSTLALASNVVGIGADSKVFVTNDANILSSMVGGGGADGTTNVSIVPWASASAPNSNSLTGGNPTSTYFTTTYGLVTYSTAGGFRVLSDAEYETDITATASDDNVKLTSATTLTADRSVNSVFVTGAGDLNLDGHTLTMNGGVLATNASSVTYSNGTFDFGSGTGYFMPGRSQQQINGAAHFQAGSGFVFASPELVRLYGTVDAGTGPVVVNSGSLYLHGNDRLAAGTDLRVDRGTSVELQAGNTQSLGSISGSGLIVGTATSSFSVGDSFVGTAGGGEVLVGDGGLIAPGDSAGDIQAGTLTFGAGIDTLHFETGSELVIELSSLSTFDMIAMTEGGVTIDGGTLTINLLDSYTPTVGDTFITITGATAADGLGFDTIVDGSGSGYLYTFEASGNDWVLTVVPEPSVYALAGGLFVLGLAQWRRRRLARVTQR